MFNNDWDNILSDEINKDYFKNIIKKKRYILKEKIYLMHLRFHMMK